MSDAAELQARISALPRVEGAVVWRLGDAPVGHLDERANPAAPGLLAAGIGSIEHVVESAGLGQIEELWFLTDNVQCLAVRFAEWQAIVVTTTAADIEALRDQITDLLDQRD